MAKAIRYLGAFLSDIEIEQYRSYLERGRAYAALSNDVLGEKWAVAFVAASRNSGPDAVVEYADLSAEIRIRHLPMPSQLIQHRVTKP
jgi:hypothetical protein